MISIYYRENGQTRLSNELSDLDHLDKEQILWVDVLGWSKSVETSLEECFGLEIMNMAESVEIEQSSRFVEYDRFVVSHSNFITGKTNHYKPETVSITLNKNTLITVRDYEFTTFKETARKLTSEGEWGSAEIFLSLIDLRIAHDADIAEGLTGDVSELSKALQNDKSWKKPLILQLNALRETLMTLMQNCMDKKLLISNFKKTRYLNPEVIRELEISTKDLDSVIDFIRFNFDRLDNMDSTLNHLFTYEQNNSMKLFTIVSLFFMPPMLIASIYGMNFRNMPELEWKEGYPLAIGAMALTVIATTIYFKRKKWL